MYLMSIYQISIRIEEMNRLMCLRIIYTSATSVLTGILIMLYLLVMFYVYLLFVYAYSNVGWFTLLSIHTLKHINILENNQSFKHFIEE